jgi:gas vesicle protein
MDMNSDEKLKKIDEIVNRTYVSYETAKQALEDADGDILEAVILIENKNKSFSSSDAKMKGEQILEEIKKVLKKGNATKITIKKNNETIVNIPITAGVVGVMLAPFLATAGVTAALLTQCSVEILQEDGNVIDVNEKVEEGMKGVKRKAEEMKDTFSESANDMKNSFSEGANEMKDTFSESANEMKNTISEGAENIKDSFNQF